MIKKTVYISENGTECASREACILLDAKDDISSANVDNTDITSDTDLSVIVDWIIWNHGWVGDLIRKSNLRGIEIKEDDENS